MKCAQRRKRLKPQRSLDYARDDKGGRGDARDDKGGRGDARNDKGGGRNIGDTDGTSNHKCYVKKLQKVA